MRTNLKYIATLVLMIFAINSFTQEKIIHDKKIYISPEGRMYIQKDLPVYLRIATSPEDNAKSYLLKSEVTTKYSNPMYFDTEGYNTVRSPSAVDTTTKKVIYPIQDIIFEVYSDSKPPVSKLDYGGVYNFKRDGKIYTRGQVKISIKSNDQMSGVDKTYYSIDGTSFKIYQDAIDLTEEKEYTLKFYAIDNVGNDEEIHTVNIIIDITKPVSKIEIDKDRDENIISGRSSILITSDDNNGIKKIFYSLDGMPEKEYRYPIRSKYLSEGDHKIAYYAVDNVDNEEAEQVFNFYVDKTPPTIVQEILGNSIIANGQEYSSGRSKLKLTTFDNKAGVKEVYYSINGGAYEQYTQPFYLSTVSGKLTIRAYALDKVNNKSTDNQEMSKSSLPYIDLSGPVIKNKFSGPVFYTRDTVYINKDTKIILQASDAEAGLNKVSYSIDGGSIEEYIKPFSVENEGMHEISFTAYDKVDNTNNKEFSVFVDNTGPEIFSRYSTQPVNEVNNMKIYPSYVVVFFSATDMVVGFDKMIYTINEAKTPKPYDGYIMGFHRDKEYTIVVKAYDKLGNISENSISFKTDTF